MASHHCRPPGGTCYAHCFLDWARHRQGRAEYQAQRTFVPLPRGRPARNGASPVAQTAAPPAQRLGCPPPRHDSRVSLDTTQVPSVSQCTSAVQGPITYWSIVTGQKHFLFDNSFPLRQPMRLGGAETYHPLEHRQIGPNTPTLPAGCAVSHVVANTLAQPWVLLEALLNLPRPLSPHRFLRSTVFARTFYSHYIRASQSSFDSNDRLKFRRVIGSATNGLTLYERSRGPCLFRLLRA